MDKLQRGDIEIMSNEIDKKVTGYLYRAYEVVNSLAPLDFELYMPGEEGSMTLEIAKMIQLEEKLYDKELAVNLKKWASFELYRASKGENNE